MSTLILDLPPLADGSPSEYGYVLCSDSGQPLQQGGAAPQLLRQRAGQRASVVGVVPSSVLSWHHLLLPRAVASQVLAPRTDNTRRHAVLAGALEEQLLDDPATLHFAVTSAEPSDASGSSDASAVWVAVMDAGWVRETLQALAAQGLHVESLVPEHEPLDQAGMGRLCVDNSLAPAAAVWSTSQGVWRMPLQAGAVRWLQERMAAEASVQVQAAPEVLALAEQTLARSAEALTQTQRLMQAQASRWNLAQGEWSVGQGSRQMRALRTGWRNFWNASAWRPTRWALGALVVVQLVALQALAWREGQSVQAQKKALAEVLTGTFPGVQVVVDAPLQMRRELDQLAQARGVSSSLDLAQVLAVVGTEPSLNLASVEMSDGRVQLHAGAEDAKDATVQARIAAALAAKGLQGRWEGDRLTVRVAEEKP